MSVVEKWLPVTGLILDIGCGNGRHLKLLRNSGRRAFGLDRSPTLLKAATALDGILVLGDMRRLPFAPGSFTGLICMFTTFGYFGSPSAHRNLLAEFARVVDASGTLVLDYLNAPAVRCGLVPRTTRVVDGHTVEEIRTIETVDGEERVVKNISISDAGGSQIEHFQERVSLYDRDELLELLSQSGWVERASLGDYDGGGWSPESDRLMVIAKKGRG